MKRKLVSIQKISNLSPIKGADFIEQATVMGWNLIVKKGEFKVGDRCVFFEIDSVLPEGPEWSEFLRRKKFRVKTLKLRGVLSQGLALPITILGGPNPKKRFIDKILFRDGWRVGDEATEFLKVRKYDPQIGVGRSGFKSGQKIRDFPSFIPKTDEIRIQSKLKYLERIKGKAIYATLKYDGTSATFYRFKDKFGVCSRNREVKQGDNVYWDIVGKYSLDKVIPEGYAIQGEICGKKIQGNKLNLKELDFFVFDVFNIKSGKYLDYNFLDNFCKVNSLNMVNVEFYSREWEHKPLEWWLKTAIGKYVGTNNDREGLVVRTADRKISFKVLNNDYLLKEK